jgi:hypothetical protein
MRLSLIILIALTACGAHAQTWHLNTEPVYFFLKSPNIALDYTINSSVAIGAQYAAIDWAAGGRNLSGIQVFYSRTGEINASSEVLKLYVGRLSPGTTLLGIETKTSPIPLFEILYGYRWVSDGNFTIAVLAGTFFTSSKIYPGVSIPVGYIF